ncbi:MAG: ATP-dependent Clp protease adaptor ClpS [Bacteroidia bacterium]
MNHTQVSPEAEELLQTGLEWSLVLYNDDVNTFEWVIDCLVKYCAHTAMQAEQCAWFVHLKGKYAVKHGNYAQLRPVCDVLQECGLSAVLESDTHE